ncbi:hypothetical protein GGX14DRAFT_296526, partial [Mycena pura]
LLNAFRIHYTRFQTQISELDGTTTDATVIARLGDDFDEFARLVEEYSYVFDNAEELTILRTSLEAMRHDIRLEYQDAADVSHHGIPPLVQVVHSGGRGRPRTVINTEFLGWAYGRRPTSGIARFLGVSRPIVRTAILEAGLAEPQENPFAPYSDFEFVRSRPVSYTGPVSGISDDDLDGLILRLRSHYRRAGLIRWGIVIHGFIDGYSRLITGLRASNNNRAETVLELFLDA